MESDHDIAVSTDSVHATLTIDDTGSGENDSILLSGMQPLAVSDNALADSASAILDQIYI